MPMTPPAVRRLHPRRHRALDPARPRPQDRTRQLHTSDNLQQLPWPAIPRSPPTTTPRPSPRSWPSTWPTTPRAAGAMRWTTKRTAPSSTGWAAPSAPRSHEAADAALAAVQELQPAPQATVLGRAEQVDMASAALLNGITSHTFDFDDTHLKTIIHPAGPVASAAAGAGRAHRRAAAATCSTRWCWASTWPAAWATPSTPSTTTAAGTSPAPPACSARPRAARACSAWTRNRTAMALGIAASQPVGLREQFGTMTKPFHPGGAARAGLMAALMAQPRLHRQPERDRGAARLGAGGVDQVRLERGRPTNWASASRSRSTATSPLPAAS